jgi:hypothetical protein
METIKCKSCGAVQEIRNEPSKCEYCSSPIELQQSKDFYKETISGEIGNLITMADTAIEATNWQEALQFYNKVLEKEITNADAWLGKGIAIVYTSKIGELKTTEAITYWKNAIKYASNQEAKGKRVAKEINKVVNSFYPNLETHFIQFKDLNNSYVELVDKFAILEKAQEYATQLDADNIELYQTGYDLCKKVIQIPNSYALADEMGAWINVAAGVVNQNKYQSNNGVTQRKDAKKRQEEIKKASVIVSLLERKYTKNIKRLSHHIPDIDFEEKFTNFLKDEEKFKAAAIYAKEKQVGLNVAMLHVEETIKSNSEYSKKKSGCFIATVAMGSYDHPVVMDLRLFRDSWLLKRKWGIAFTEWYYTHGPKAAKIIEKSFVLKKLAYLFIVKPLQIITLKFR